MRSLIFIVPWVIYCVAALAWLLHYQTRQGADSFAASSKAEGSFDG
jgi:hypothetical protein